jgi:cytochrome c oxidase assembly protein subunit 15
MTAYVLWVLALVHAIDVARTLRGGPVLTHALALAAAITIQAALGILTLIHQVPIGLALAHQAIAILVLAMSVIHVERLAAKPTTVAIHASAPSR